jgi:hypothetical protein
MRIMAVSIEGGSSKLKVQRSRKAPRPGLQAPIGQPLIPPLIPGKQVLKPSSETWGLELLLNFEL